MNENLSIPSTMDYETLSLEELLGAGEVPGFKQKLSENPEDLILRGTLHRAGRAGFYHWLEQRREILGWQDPVFRFAPVRKKIAIGLEKVCEVIETESNVTLTLRNTKDRWTIDVHSKMRGDPLRSDYLAGFVQEFAGWAGLGKFYRVVNANEIKGDHESYSITLYKNPIDN